MYYKVIQTTTVVVEADSIDDAITTAIRGEFTLINSDVSALKLTDMEIDEVLDDSPSSGTAITTTTLRSVQ